MWGPGVSEGGRGSVPVREKGRMGRGLQLVLGRFGSPGSVLYFSFVFFFSFLVSLFKHSTFAKVLQFKPNFFQRFSKGLHIILSQ
jgi:hypothetical protein